MSFASYEFLFYFLPAALTLALLAGWISARYLLVPSFLFISLAFYAYSSIPHLLLLLCLIVLSWLSGFVFVRAREAGRVRKAEASITLGVAVNLCALLIWKYSPAFISLWNELGWIQAKDLGVVLPLGISFYVLQQIGFLLDLRRNRAKVGSLLDYATYIAFFPQLLSGPIVTSRRMSREFGRVRTGIAWRERADMAALGLAWIAIGLFKKVCIADTLRGHVGPYIEQAAYFGLTPLEALQISLASGPIIYFDFCGYSDMAVGLGLLFGVKLPYNFNAPQRASSNREGWRRWHITFHDFIRDHLYGPLQRRLGQRRLGMVLVFFIVFAVSALWHGDSPRFVVWGVLTFAAFVALNWAGSVLPTGPRRWVEQSSRYLMALSLPLIFLTPDLAVASDIIFSIFSLDGWVAVMPAVTRNQVIAVTGLIVLMVLWSTEISTQNLLSANRTHPERTVFGWRPPAWSPNLLWAGFIISLFLASFLMLGSSQRFVYTQF